MFELSISLNLSNPVPPPPLRLQTTVAPPQGEEEIAQKENKQTLDPGGNRHKKKKRFLRLVHKLTNDNFCKAVSRHKRSFCVVSIFIFFCVNSEVVVGSAWPFARHLSKDGGRHCATLRDFEARTAAAAAKEEGGRRRRPLNLEGGRVLYFLLFLLWQCGFCRFCLVFGSRVNIDMY